jgi:hypothetical protein
VGDCGYAFDIYIGVGAWAAKGNGPLSLRAEVGDVCAPANGDAGSCHGH